MKDYKRDYYEQPCFWETDHLRIPGQAERINETMRAIPADVRTVLDVGCGNGIFVNTLYRAFPDRFERIVGLDQSTEALRHVTTEKINVSIDRMPLEWASLDLVSCLEVLEHLQEEEFTEGICEIERVSRKYILISVPNDESLEQSLVLCPKCCCAFSRYFHMRSFSSETLDDLFTNFRPIMIREIGPDRRSYFHNSFMFFLRLCYKRPAPPATSICPQCGYQTKRKASDNRGVQKTHSVKLQKVLAWVKPLITRRKKKQWLLALYARMDR